MPLNFGIDHVLISVWREEAAEAAELRTLHGRSFAESNWLVSPRLVDPLGHHEPCPGV
jgi:hypothetical protein